MTSNEVTLREQVINEFVILGRQVEGVYDILVRGSSSCHKTFRPGWSDIDFSIIVLQVNFDVMEKIRDIYKYIIEKFNIKISITVPTKSDYHRTHHHHGIKALFYNNQLEKSQSLIQGTFPQRKQISEFILRFDALANVVYLVHDMRKNNLKRGEDKNSLSVFCKHLLDRTLILIKNSIFIMKGYEIEKSNIDPQLFSACFPEISRSLVDKLSAYTNEWPQIKDNEFLLESIIKDVLPITEEIYEITTQYAEKNLALVKSE